jgi:hypothetical protein
MKEILELLGVLHRIFPKEETINPFYKIKLEDYPATYSHCFKLLTHYLTLIYKNHRPMDKSSYITSREDIVASLNLLEIMTLKTYRTQQSTAIELHEILKKNTKPGQILSAKNIREIINYKKSQAHQFIQILIKMNKLEQVGGHRNIGYLYQLKE